MAEANYDKRSVVLGISLQCLTIVTNSTINFPLKNIALTKKAMSYTQF